MGVYDVAIWLPDSWTRTEPSELIEELLAYPLDEFSAFRTPDIRLPISFFRRDGELVAYEWNLNRWREISPSQSEGLLEEYIQEFGQDGGS